MRISQIKPTESDQNNILSSVRIETAQAGIMRWNRASRLCSRNNLSITPHSAQLQPQESFLLN